MGFPRPTSIYCLVVCAAADLSPVRVVQAVATHWREPPPIFLWQTLRARPTKAMGLRLRPDTALSPIAYPKANALAASGAPRSRNPCCACSPIPRSKTWSRLSAILSRQIRLRLRNRPPQKVLAHGNAWWWLQQTPSSPGRCAWPSRPARSCPRSVNRPTLSRCPLFTPHHEGYVTLTQLGEIRIVGNRTGRPVAPLPQHVDCDQRDAVCGDVKPGAV